MKVCCVICIDGVCRPRVCELLRIGDETHLVMSWASRRDGTRVPVTSLQISMDDLVNVMPQADALPWAFTLPATVEPKYEGPRHEGPRHEEPRHEGPGRDGPRHEEPPARWRYPAMIRMPLGAPPLHCFTQ